MKLKRFALRGLIALGVMVALCMFFARTVQTITTPKVQRVEATTGRFEDKMTFQAKVHFPKSEEMTIEAAKDLPVTVKSVLVQPGHYVEKGETIFTAEAASYDADMKKLREEYDAKAKELMDLDIENRKLSKESKQNELYDAMLDAQSALSDAMYEARLLAQSQSIRLAGEVSGWSQQLALAGKGAQELRKAVQKAQTAQETYNAASAAFYEVLENKKLKVKDNVFKYINDRNALIKAMDALTEDMVALNATKNSLTSIAAPRDGYIVSVAVEAGATYDGATPAYVMTAADSVPVLRAPLNGVERTIADGTKAEIVSDALGSAKTTVEKTAKDTDGTDYLYIALPEDMLAASGDVRRMVNAGGVEVNITYRAKKATTLLSPSVVRGQEGGYYVYLIQHNWGGFMASDQMKVVKTPVTVIEKNGKMVSVEEELGYQQIADREDRALEDGQVVMDYVQ